MDDWGIVYLLSVSTAAAATTTKWGSEEWFSKQFCRSGVDEGLPILVDGSQVVGGLCRKTRRSMIEKGKRGTIKLPS